MGVGECEAVAEAPGVGVAERERLPDDVGVRDGVLVREAVADTAAEREAERVE